MSEVRNRIKDLWVNKIHLVLNLNHKDLSPTACQSVPSSHAFRNYLRTCIYWKATIYCDSGVFYVDNAKLRIY